jgi:CHAT domain-containing protein
LTPHLGDASSIFISTDGMLGQLPFAALPGKTQQTYLIEDQAVVMLPVPTLLPKMMQRPKSEPGPQLTLLMGDVDYDSAAPVTPLPDSKSAESLLLARKSLRSARDNETYNSLPATGAEIDAIAGVFRTNGIAAGTEIVQLRGSGATESAFRGLAERAGWIHLASHGFFAAADKPNALIAEKKDERQLLPEPLGLMTNRSRAALGFSPGQLSGLVFAGANRRPTQEDAASSIETLDDGIMTADEIMYLQLENLELAVLSACETGLGETAGGEGILGLQRALQIAGARTTVTSLWKVDDAATQALMVEFYRNYFERKLSKLESLRQAQLWLLNNPETIEGRSLTTRGSVRPINITDETKTAPEKPKRSLPSYWAAFQLSGDPR